MQGKKAKGTTIKWRSIRKEVEIMDGRTEKLVALLNQIGAEIDPSEFEKEEPEEEIIYEWEELSGGNENVR